MTHINPVVGEAEFEQMIQSATQPFVFVDFWADWCGPCRLVHPMLEKIHNDPAFQDKVKIVQADIDESDNRPLALKYKIMSIPNMLLFGNVNGRKELIARRIGVSPEPVFRDWLVRVMEEYTKKQSTETANTELPSAV